MTITLISLAVILATAYVWMTRGFFSAFIHMMCTVAAGAIAFAAWEPLGYWLLDVAPDRGFGTFIGGMAWAIALAAPFAVSLAVLRGVVDLMLPANAPCDPVVDYIGGGVCGLVSGVITAGFLVLTVGFLRLPPESLGYNAVRYSEQAMGRGSIEANKETFVPWADRITAGLYERLSLASFRTGSPLGRLYPEFEQVPAAMRMNFEGKSRNTMRAEDLKIDRWYTVGDAARGGDMNALLTDAWNPDPQRFVDPDGEPINNGHLAGFLVNFGPGAKEKGGQVVVGAGQARLVVQKVDPTVDGPDAKPVYPIAVISSVADPASTALARFRFDGTDVFVASVGAGADAPMAFEFPVPRGYRAASFYVKNIRFDVPQQADETFDTPAQRDAAIQAGRFIPGRTGAEVGSSADAGPSAPRTSTTGLPEGVQMSNSLGGRLTLQRGTFDGLDLDPESNAILNGETKIAKDRLGKMVDRALRVDRFAATPDTVMVQVNTAGPQANSLLGRAMATAEMLVPPVLVDSQGRTYPAIGFIYVDSSLGHIRFTPGQPLRGLSDAPSISRSRTDQQLALLFRVNFGSEIVALRIGNREVLTFSPPMKADQKQR